MSRDETIEIQKSFLVDLLLQCPTLLRLYSASNKAERDAIEFVLSAAKYVSVLVTHKGLLDYLTDLGGDLKEILPMITLLKAELGVFCASSEEYSDARDAIESISKSMGVPYNNPVDSAFSADDSIDDIVDKIYKEISKDTDMDKEELRKQVEDQLKACQDTGKIKHICIKKKRGVEKVLPFKMDKGIPLAENLVSFFNHVCEIGYKKADSANGSDVSKDITNAIKTETELFAQELEAYVKGK